MKARLRALLRASGLGLLLLAVGVAAQAAEVHVMTSGAFSAAYRELVPIFERETGHRVHSAFGASQGGAADSIPSRLARGEPADLVILAGPALDGLVRAGRVVEGSRVDLVSSAIGLSVRAGAPRPDISTVDALVRTLLAAKSIAYSASASGTYLSQELFPRLGVSEAIRDRVRRIESERVGSVVARGEAELGFQQVSELLPIPGLDYVGPLPEGAQRVTLFSAGLSVTSREPEVARQLLAFFRSDRAAEFIRRTGLDPVR